MRIWALLLLVGCGTYDVNRAALVPRATPRMVTGEQLSGRGQIDLGAASVAHFGDPGAGDESAGVKVPGTQLFGGGRLRLGKYMSIGAIYQNGLDQGAKGIHERQPAVNNGSVIGYGINVDAAIPIDDKLTLGLGIESIAWSIPYVEYYNCAVGEDCFPYRYAEKGRELVSTMGLSVTPNYRIDESLALFGQLHLRNHPTVRRFDVSVDPGVFDDTEIESGPANIVVAAGVDASLAGGALRLGGMIFYEVTRNPVKYTPGLSLMLSVPLGRGPVKRGDQPVVYQPTGPYQYGPPPGH